MTDLILHCNYVEQGQSIDQMCTLAARWGYDGIEFRSQREDVEESPEAYLDAIQKAAARVGLRHVLFGAPGPDLTLPDPDARRQQLDRYANFLRLAAKRFDLSVCNTMAGNLVDQSQPGFKYDCHGSALATEALWDHATRGFQELGQLAGELGIRLAFETHMLYLHDLPQPTRQLVDRIGSPAVGINLDYANMFVFPNPPTPPEALQACAGQTYLVHLKNVYLVPGQTYQNSIPCPLGAGAINNRELLRELFRLGYDGPLVIEAPRQGDREEFAQQDLAYVRSVLSELET